MAPTIELTRKAAELREKASVKLEDFKGFLMRQATDALEDGETRLSNTEITERQQDIEKLVSEAKAIQGVANLDGMLAQPENASPEAKGLMEILTGLQTPVEEKEPGGSDFRGVGEFLRSIRGLNGPSPSVEIPELTDGQKEEMVRMYHGATLYSKGEPFHKEIMRAPGAVEARRQITKTLVGDDNTSTGRGDYLVPTEHMAELLRAMGEQQQFASRCRHIPMSRRTLDFPRLAQTTASDTRPIYGFAAITKIGESTTKPEHEPVFEQLLLTAIKYAAYVEASDELLSDSIIGLAPVLIDLLTSATAYEFDRDTMRGTGTAEPQGFLGHASEWTQNRAGAGAVGLADILGLEERFFGDNGIFLHHPSVLPQLGALAASNVIFWNRDVSSSLPGTLLGRPLVRTHKLPVLGTKGDICLVDPSFYLVGDLQAITVASSNHYRFRNDVTAWRSIYRAAGTPWPAGLFSMESSGAAMTYRVSPFCVLDVVATS